MTALLVREIASLQSAMEVVRQGGKSIGLVPTMGALHAGHAHLIETARKENDFLVVSLFVNPTQFGPGEDLARYPRQLPEDQALCKRLGVDLLFAPEAEAMYPPGHRTQVEVTQLQDVLCGPSRPGHFRGVATIVLKLFNLVGPTRAYFGQKDGQQLRIIQQMVCDLNVPVEIVAVATVREPDGLALSSRNVYLDAEQRRQAPQIFRALCEARRQIEAGQLDGRAIQQLLQALLPSGAGVTLDYAAVVDADTLEPLSVLQGTVLIAVAVKLGATRLIDNIVVQV